MKEIWKDIPGYEGYYQVSNLGRVKSLDRQTRGGSFLKGKKLKQWMGSNEYYSVSLSKYNVKRNFEIHKLIAITFLNHQPCGFKIVVDHKDNNKINNNLDNLRLISNRENSSQEHLPSSSKYIGVCKSGNRWRAAIVVNKIDKKLGTFDTEEEASEYYQDALKCINKNKISDIKVKKPIYSSKYTGVYYNKTYKNWSGKIYKNKKTTHIGVFKTELEAYIAVQNARAK